MGAPRMVAVLVAAAATAAACTCCLPSCCSHTCYLPGHCGRPRRRAFILLHRCGRWRQRPCQHRCRSRRPGCLGCFRCMGASRGHAAEPGGCSTRPVRPGIAIGDGGRWCMLASACAGPPHPLLLQPSCLLHPPPLPVCTPTNADGGTIRQPGAAPRGAGWRAAAAAAAAAGAAAAAAGGCWYRLFQLSLEARGSPGAQPAAAGG